MEPFTDEQARFAARQMSRWLQIRADHENLESRLHWALSVGAKKQILGQIRADVDHSALLYRLLRGKEPLPEPPPTEHAYPAYPDWPY